MVSLWGFRLSYYILRRNKKVEDFRYKHWRETWGNYFALKAFFRIFMLQALIMYTVSLTLTFSLNNTMSILSMFIVGVAVWLSGYVIEVISDKQMREFKKSNKGLINVGLWRLSRHPNYFGEIVMWVGFFIISLAYGAPVWMIVSPLLMYSIFEFISIPILEKKYDDRKEYQEYKNKTNKLIPIRRG
jgi:steroid 5-alpha reductase family enzyme